MDTQNLTRLRLEQTWKQARRRLHSNPQQLRLLKLSYSFTVLEFKLLKFIVPILTDTGEDSKFVLRRKRPKVDTPFSSLFFWRVRGTSMTQRRVKNTRVHFWTFLPLSVKFIVRILKSVNDFSNKIIFWEKIYFPCYNFILYLPEASVTELRPSHSLNSGQGSGLDSGS